VTIHESNRLGRLDLGRQLAALARGTAVYACGPPEMLDTVAAVCADQPAVDSFTERFTAPPVTGAPNQQFELSLAFSGLTVTVPEDRTILDVLDARGVVAPSSCREGMCGTCETGVVSGEVDHRDVILSPEERSENESMMICVSRCTSGRLVLEL
jgi:ferredoxin